MASRSEKDTSGQTTSHANADAQRLALVYRPIEQLKLSFRTASMTIRRTRPRKPWIGPSNILPATRLNNSTSGIS